MEPQVRVLHLEDNLRDAEVIADRLNADENAFHFVGATGKESFEAAVLGEAFDLILCDYNIPGYDGMEAIRFVRAHRPATPVVVLSGMVGDEKAVECLKAGAADFVLKHNLSRLVLVIARALAESRSHQAMSQRNAELRLSEERFQMMVENVTDYAILMLDTKGLVTSWNSGAQRIKGYCAQEIIGKHFSCFYPEEVASAGCPERILAIAAKEGRFAEEGWRVRKDGTRFMANVVVTAMFDEARQLQGFSKVTRDITELKLAEQSIRQLNADLEDRVHQRTIELSAANAELASASRAKSEFLATMSHELRTPLNGIIGMNDLLLTTELTERQRKYVQACSSSGKQLLQLINDILDLSKIEAGKLELDPRECDMEALIYDVADMMLHSARQRGLSLQCRIAPEACTICCCDDNRLRQVLLNLVNNALKFTATGSVTINCARIARADGASRLRFSVVDTGIGIPMERRDRLFQAFSQVDSTTARHYGGTGLGLSICRELVELMEGEIGVESEVGVGSTFWFEVPVKIVCENSGWERKRRLLAGVRFIAIEGVRQEWQQVEDCLRSWGCSFEQIATSKEALDTVASAAAAGNSFKIVLADCRLAKGDEYAALQKLASFPDLQVIGLGIPLDEASMNYFRSLGVRHVLPDPIRPSALLDAISSVLSVSDGIEVSQENWTAPARSPTPKIAGHILVAEDNRINQLYIVDLLNNFGCTVDVVANGEEVLAAVEKQQYDLLLMDCQMPEMDGFAATREIRKREAAHLLPGRLPILALTANALKGDRELCMNAGMDDYASKPVDRDRMQAVLEKFLGLSVGAA